MKKLLLILVLLLFLQPVFANADTAILDPIADGGTLEWTPYDGSTPHCERLDDGVRYPDTPDGTDGIIRAFDGCIDIIQLDTLAGNYSVSNVTIWVYGQGSNNGVVDISIYAGGAWADDQNAGFADGGTPSWQAISFDGAWTQADFPASVRLTDTAEFGANIQAVYAVITYTAEEAPPAAPARKPRIIIISE